MSFLLFCLGSYIGVSTCVMIDQHNSIKYLKEKEEKNEQDLCSESKQQ